MSANPFPAANHGPHTLKKHVLRIRNLERRPGGAGSRRVYGQISEDPGALVLDAGSDDWTAVTDDAGTITITVDPPFAVVPTVVASENGTTAEPPSFVQVYSATEDTIVIHTYDKTGVLSDDRGFNFQAIGA